MNAVTVLGLIVIALGCSGPTAPVPGAGTTAAATADLKDATGRTVGTATLSESGGGVRVVVDIAGLPPGDKALHVHEVGQCEAPTFDSAKSHFNPMGKEHGTANPRGPHGGDLPNITVDASGRGRLDVTTDQITLRPGPISIFDGDGSTMVMHAGPDDMRTDPAGNSGNRIACGVIVPATRG